jgi:hypothetical protein
MVGLGIGSWITGYRKSDYFPPDTTIRFLTKPIFPPQLLYFICGAPKSQKYPKGVMTAWAFSTQLNGFGIFIHLLVTILFKQNSVGMAINFTIIFSLLYGITYWLAKNKAYKRSRTI